MSSTAPAREVARGTRPKTGPFPAMVSEIFEVDHGDAGLLALTFSVKVVRHPGGRPGQVHIYSEMVARAFEGAEPRKELQARIELGHQLDLDKVLLGTRVWMLGWRPAWRRSSGRTSECCRRRHRCQNRRISRRMSWPGNHMSKHLYEGDTLGMRAQTETSK